MQLRTITFSFIIEQKNVFNNKAFCIYYENIVLPFRAPF